MFNSFIFLNYIFIIKKYPLRRYESNEHTS